MSGMRIDARVSCFVSRRCCNRARLQCVDTFIRIGFGILLYFDGAGCGAGAWVSKTGVFTESIVGVFRAFAGVWRGEKHSDFSIQRSFPVRILATNYTNITNMKIDFSSLNLCNSWLISMRFEREVGFPKAILRERLLFAGSRLPLRILQQYRRRRPDASARRL